VGRNGEGRSGMGRSGFILISHTLSSQLFELLCLQSFRNCVMSKVKITHHQELISASESKECQADGGISSLQNPCMDLL